MLAHIYSCASRFMSRRHRPDSGRSCDDITSFYQDSSFSYSSLKASAVPIIASRVSLPSSVGSADLLSLLPRSISSNYSSPTNLLRPPDQVKRVPHVVKYASTDEYVSLVRRMRVLGMVTFTTTPAVVNGVFGVSKDADTDRLIIDARPVNAVMVDPPKVALPTPDLLARMVAPSDKPFFVAKVDLDNYYHRMRLPEWMQPYFALPCVRAGDVGVGDLFGCDTMVYPCCTTLPMGWSHSVYLGQVAHEHQLDTRTSLSRDDRITGTSDLRLDRVRHKVYVDDLMLFGPDPQALHRLQDEYVAAMESAGLVVKMSKLVRPTSSGVECVGLEVCGDSHQVGLAVDKLDKLCTQTLSLLDSGYCTGFQLAQLLGKWTWACLVNRPSLSVLSSAYRFVERAGPRVFCVWPSVHYELRTLVGLAPLLFATLDAQWFGRVIATDASESGQGVVVTSPDVSTLPDASPSPLDVAETMETADHSWTTIVSAKFAREEHINTLELRAVYTAVRWVLSFPSSPGRRVVILCDSLVTIGCVTKGRSSSHVLLPRLRQLASVLLASGLRLYLRWVPSAQNPADGPSRAYDQQL